MDWLTQLSATVSHLASSWGVFPVITGVAAIDGFFPPIPAETSVIAVASVLGSLHEWNRALLLVLFAALGAVIGDSVAYWIGRLLQPHRWGVFRRGKGLAAYQWATRQFQRMGGALIVIARYIPVGRVAVNIVSGTLRMPYRRFLLFDATAGALWAIYATGLGIAGGAVAHNPLIALGIGLVLAFVVGWIVQHVVGKKFGPAGTAADAVAGPEPGGASAQSER